MAPLAFAVLVLVGSPSSAALAPQLLGVNDWLYVLQPEAPADLTAIADTDFDLVVIDYSADGSAAGEFTAQQIAALKASGKVVLAYLSIGEAETYRYYWDPAWNDDPPPDPDAPSWLGPFNPSFPDNFKVRYWQAGWQSILFGTPTGPDRSYLDRIVDQGFDGVYLDIIDAFYFWSEVVGELTREQARSHMIDLVAALADYARVTRNRPDFLLFPQNGEDIVVNDDDQLDAAGLAYLAAIDGVGVEDVFYDEVTPQPAGEVQYRTDILDHYLGFGGNQRLVLSTDYVWDPAAPNGAANRNRYNDYQGQALGFGYVPYAAVRDRDLNEIVTVEAAGGFLYPQPKPAELIFADGFENGDTSAWSAAQP